MVLYSSHVGTRPQLPCIHWRPFCHLQLASPLALLALKKGEGCRRRGEGSVSVHRSVNVQTKRPVRKSQLQSHVPKSPGPPFNDNTYHPLASNCDNSGLYQNNRIDSPGITDQNSGTTSPAEDDFKFCNRDLRCKTAGASRLLK